MENRVVVARVWGGGAVRGERVWCRYKGAARGSFVKGIVLCLDYSGGYT